MKLLTDDEITSLNVPAGRFFGPCSGGDLPIAFRLIGNRIDRFTFCDLAYCGRRASARSAVPDGWTLISRVSGRDEQQGEKSTWYSRNRPLQPCVTIEVWRRPDGSEVLVELRRDLAQDALRVQFAPGSIAAFMHINDSTGEGGSNLWFLASEHYPVAQEERGMGLLEQVARQLAHGAVLLTDGVLADPKFREDRLFEQAAMRWEPLGEVRNYLRSGRRLSLWRALALNF